MKPPTREFDPHHSSAPVRVCSLFVKTLPLCFVLVLCGASPARAQTCVVDVDGFSQGSSDSAGLGEEAADEDNKHISDSKIFKGNGAHILIYTPCEGAGDCEIRLAHVIEGTDEDTLVGDSALANEHGATVESFFYGASFEAVVIDVTGDGTPEIAVRYNYQQDGVNDDEDDPTADESLGDEVYFFALLDSQFNTLAHTNAYGCARPTAKVNACDKDKLSITIDSCGFAETKALKAPAKSPDSLGTEAPLSTLDDRPYAVISGSFSSGQPGSHQAAVELMEKLFDAGFSDVEIIDSREFTAFRCCYHTVIVGRFPTLLEAEARAEAVIDVEGDVSFEAYVKKAFALPVAYDTLPEEPPELIQDDLPYVVITGSFKSGTSGSAEAARTLMLELKDGGYQNAEVYDGRAFSKFRCCFFSVIAGRFQDKSDAKDLAEVLGNDGFDAYVKRAFD